MALNGQKTGPFSKTDSCNENARFFYLPTQIVFANFSKKCHFNKKDLFLHNNHPKTLFFWFFEMFLFHFFHLFSFALSNIKRQKQKMHFFWSLFFWHLDNRQKICSHPYILLVFFRYPPKHYKTGGKQAKQILDRIFDSTLARFLTQKRPNLGQIFDSTACIYIYIHIHAVAPRILANLWSQIFKNLIPAAEPSKN